jgi:hypothetical protein
LWGRSKKSADGQGVRQLLGRMLFPGNSRLGWINRARILACPIMVGPSVLSIYFPEVLPNGHKRTAFDDGSR